MIYAREHGVHPLTLGMVLTFGALLSVVTAIILLLGAAVLVAHRHRQLIERQPGGRRKRLNTAKPSNSEALIRRTLWFSVSPCDPVPSVNSVTRDTE